MACTSDDPSAFTAVMPLSAAAAEGAAADAASGAAATKENRPSSSISFVPLSFACNGRFDLPVAG